MSIFLLIMIYIAFISLGLPDSLLGSGWPVIRENLGLNVSDAGIVSMVISLGTVLSSLSSSYLLKKLGTIKVVIISVTLTCVALFGFSLSNSLLFFLFFAIPLGVGAGAIDASLNHYVSLNYKAKHMNWLHASWGIGATISPLVMGLAISQTDSWRNGYLIVAIFQSILVLSLILTKYLWNKSSNEDKRENIKTSSLREINGVIPALLCFFAYCAVEQSAGLWGASYLVSFQGISSVMATSIISFYYFGIMLGRVINGFLTFKFNNKQLIKFGIILIFIGVFILFFKTNYLFILGFLLVGLGCAPIFPSMIHESPRRFGKENAIKLMGLQMASAYIGTLLIPISVGFIVSNLSFILYPVMLLIFAIILFISNELVNSKTIKNYNQFIK